MKNAKYYKEEDIEDSRLGVGYCHTSYEEGEFKTAGKRLFGAKKNEQYAGFVNKAGQVYLYASLNCPLSTQVETREHIIAEVEDIKWTHC